MIYHRQPPIQLRPAATNVLKVLVGSATSSIKRVSTPSSPGIIELAQSIVAHLKVTQLTPLFFGKQAGVSINPPLPLSDVYDTRVGALMEIASSDRTLLAEAMLSILLKQPGTLQPPQKPTPQDLQKIMEQLRSLR